jgi:peroxiredoxin
MILLLLVAGVAAAVVVSRPRGTPARLDFVLPDMNGRDIRLAEFKGRPLLLNFWATWCPPCKAEIPSFIELADKYRAQGLAVLGVSVDDDPAAIRQFAAEYKVNYPLLVGRGRTDLIAEYGAGLVVPVSWLIEADGTLGRKVEGLHSKAWFDAEVRAMIARAPDSVD